MPFQSEKQRRYLWANEPKIAREWTDRYGAAGGGIMDIASDGNLIHDFENYKKGKRVNVPTSFQARSHSTPVNLAYITDEEAGILQALKPDTPHEGPMGIPNYDDYDPTGGYRSGAAMSAAESGKHTSDTLAAGIGNQELQNIKSGAIAAGAGQTVNPGWFGPRHRPGISKQDLRAAKQFAPKAYRATRGSPFGIGNLFRGAMSMFGGIPGKIGSMLSHINPGKLRGWNEQYGRYNTQDEYEQARTNRRNTKRMDYLSDRKSRGLGYGKKAYGDLLGQGYSDPFQEALNRDLQINPETTQFSRSHLQSLANKQALTNQLSAKDFINLDQSISASGYKPRGFMENLQSKFGSEVRPAAALSKEKILGTDWANTEIQWDNIKPGRVSGSQKVFDRLKADPTINTWGDLYQAGLSGQVENIGGAQIMTRNPEGLAALGKEMPYGMELGKQGSWGDLEVEDLYERIPGAGASKYHINVPLIGEEETRGTFGLTGRGKGDFLQKDVEEKLRAAGWLSQGGRVRYGAGGLASLWPR